jgi:hypothetical protein
VPLDPFASSLSSPSSHFLTPLSIAHPHTHDWRLAARLHLRLKPSHPSPPPAHLLLFTDEDKRRPRPVFSSTGVEVALSSPTPARRSSSSPAPARRSRPRLPLFSFIFSGGATPSRTPPQRGFGSGVAGPSRDGT